MYARGTILAIFATPVLHLQVRETTPCLARRPQACLACAGKFLDEWTSCLTHSQLIVTASVGCTMWGCSSLKKRSQNSCWCKWKTNMTVYSSNFLVRLRFDSTVDHCVRSKWFCCTVL